MSDFESVGDHSDDESYQDTRQSSGVSMRDGQYPSHLPMADGRESSGTACDQTVVDGRPQGQSSRSGSSHQPFQLDQGVTVRTGFYLGKKF